MKKCIHMLGTALLSSFHYKQKIPTGSTFNLILIIILTRESVGRQDVERSVLNHLVVTKAANLDSLPVLSELLLYAVYFFVSI